MSRPVIGVMPLYDDEKQSLWMLPGYFEGIRRAGGIPVMLPPELDPSDFSVLAEGIDGYLFTGGHDVSPFLYGEVPLPACGKWNKDRDRLEEIVYRYCFENDIPLLGICRGIQFINVMMGGTLWQDLESQRPSAVHHHMEPPYDRTAHQVRILPDTPLYALLEKESLGVNSYHHQAVRDLGEDLVPMAVSEDGLTEGIYVPDKKWIWGIQWHPEYSYVTDPDSMKIFTAFVEAAKRESS